MGEEKKTQPQLVARLVDGGIDDLMGKNTVWYCITTDYGYTLLVLLLRLYLMMHYSLMRRSQCTQQLLMAPITLAHLLNLPCSSLSKKLTLFLSL